MSSEHFKGLEVPRFSGVIKEEQVESSGLDLSVVVKREQEESSGLILEPVSHADKLTCHRLPIVATNAESKLAADFSPAGCSRKALLPLLRGGWSSYLG